MNMNMNMNININKYVKRTNKLWIKKIK